MLGVEINRDRVAGTALLTQRGYHKDLLERSNLGKVHPCSTPCDASIHPGEKFCPGTDPERAHEKAKLAALPFRERAGGLLWSKRTTRPDYSYVAGMLSRVMHDPGFVHWNVSTTALSYLRGTQNLSIAYRRSDGPVVLHGYVDADYLPDYGTADTNRRSTTGWCFFVAGAVTS